MKLAVFLFAVAVTASTPGWQQHVLGSNVNNAQPTLYPSVRRSDRVFTYKSKEHGTVNIPDSYDWLEADVTPGSEPYSFYKTQNAFTQQFVDQCTDAKAIQQMLDTAQKYRNFRAPHAEGPDSDPTYYYQTFDGVQSQWSWFAASYEEILHAEKENYANLPGKKFFDANLLSSDNSISVEGMYFSPTGKTIAYALSSNGSDWQTIYFRNADKPFVTPATDPAEAAKGGPDRLPDELKNVKFSDVSFSQDGKGILYQTYPRNTAGQNGEDDTPINAKLLYHRIGTSQDQDLVIVDKDPSIPAAMWDGVFTEDGLYVVLTSNVGSVETRVYIGLLNHQSVSASIKWLSIAPKLSYGLTYIDNVGDTFYFTTSKDAPNAKLVSTKIDASKARIVKHVSELHDESTFKDVIAERANAQLDGVLLVNKNKLLAWYIKDVKHELYQYDLQTGKQVQRLLPDLLGTISIVRGRKHRAEAFVAVISLTTPYFVHRLQWNDGGKDPYALPQAHQHLATKLKSMDLTKFKTEQVFVPSEGNVKVPLYLVHRTDVPINDTTPAVLFFYGGYGDPLMPFFSPTFISWTASYGALMVFVNARGGGEYGDKWHDDGRLSRKKNTFYDILAAAHYVVNKKLAGAGKILLHGRSMGGLAALAVGNMAPEGLIGAVLPDVPPADLLRYSLFSTGQLNIPELGDPQDPEMFDYLHSYSPYHNVDAKKAYPFYLITTATNDERLPPMHSFKMVSQLQYALPNNQKHFLLHVSEGTGHEQQSGQEKDFDDDTLRICLSAQALGLKRLPLPGQTA